MRATIPMLAGAAALLAACGDKAGNDAAVSPVDTSTGPQTAEQVRAQAAKVKIRPGQWQGSFTLEDIEMTGMPGGTPPQMLEQMQQAMSRTDTRYCVTQEEAENPDGKMFSGQDNKDCTYSGFDASGGAIKGQVSCKAQDGTMTAIMSGTYAPERYDMKMDMKMQGAPHGMAMKARTSGQWIGPVCA